MWTEYYYNTSTLSGYIGSGSGILSGANNSDFIVRSEADFVVATGNNRRLTIASTGAATFSSSVNAQLLTIQNGYYLVGRNAANTAYRTLVTFDSSNRIIIGQDSDITAITLGVNSEAMRITSGGDVGIGTTGGINVASGWTNLTANGSTTGIIGVQIAGTNFGAMYGNLANNNFVLQAYGTSNTANMVFLTASTERMRITSSGNVLIGRTTSGLNNTEGVTISSGSIQPEGNSYVFYGNRHQQLLLIHHQITDLNKI